MPESGESSLDLQDIAVAFVEHNGTTYRKKPNSDEPDESRWCFNFILRLKTAVHSEQGNDSISGFIVSLDVENQGHFDSFVPNTAWLSVDKFCDALRSNAKPRSPIIVKRISTYEFQDFARKKIEHYHELIKEEKHPFSREAVCRLGQQPDSTTFIFGPDAVFVLVDGNYVRRNISESDYQWIDGVVPKLVIPENCEKSINVIDYIQPRMSAKTVNCFVMCSGGILMGMHYKSVLENFDHCPTVMSVGDPNSGKSLSTTVGMDQYGLNASKLLEVISVTPAAVRSMLAKQAVPLLLHDPSAPEVVQILIEESYDAKPATNTRESVASATSAIVTCNPDLLAKLRTAYGMRCMSRLVLIPFKDQYQSAPAKQQVKERAAKLDYKRYVKELLLLDDGNLLKLAENIDEISSFIEAELERYDMREALSRIAANLACVYAFALRFLEIVDGGNKVDRLALREFVLKDMVRFAAQWQVPTNQPKRNIIPAAPCSPSKRKPVVPSKPPVTLDEYFAKVAACVDCSAIQEYVRIKDDKVAFRLSEFRDKMKAKAVDAEWIDAFEVLAKSACQAKKIDPALVQKSKQTRFGQLNLRCAVVPHSVLAPEILSSLQPPRCAPKGGADEQTPDEVSCAKNYELLNPADEILQLFAPTSGESEVKDTASMGDNVTLNQESKTDQTNATVDVFLVPSPQSAKDADSTGSRIIESSVAVGLDSASRSTDTENSKEHKCTNCGSTFSMGSLNIVCASKSCPSEYCETCAGPKAKTNGGKLKKNWKCDSCVSQGPSRQAPKRAASAKAHTQKKQKQAAVVLS